ncbi:hypothetical protein T492DRAFT_874126, partial [Pavlovales sp. CCMP2436]
MRCFLMRAAASIGLTPISAYILRPPCALTSKRKTRVSLASDVETSTLAVKGLRHTWMGKLSAPTTMQVRNTLLGLMRKELGVI